MTYESNELYRLARKNHMTADDWFEVSDYMETMLENGENVTFGRSDMPNWKVERFDNIKLQRQLSQAVKAGDAAKTRELLEKGAKLREFAYVSGEMEATEKAPKRMLNDAYTDDNYIAVTQAAKLGHLEVLKVLVEYGADVNEDHAEGLRWAAALGHMSVIEFLISKGADVNATDPDDYNFQSPLSAAAEYRQMEALCYLIERGANVESNFDALIKSADYGGLNEYRAMFYLLDNGADEKFLREHLNGNGTTFLCSKNESALMLLDRRCQHQKLTMELEEKPLSRAEQMLNSCQVDIVAKKKPAIRMKL